jgi:rod shape-determining protein MreC
VAVYRRPARRRFVLLVLTLLSITIITLDQRGSGPIGSVRRGVRNALDPVQGALTSATHTVGDFFTSIGHGTDLKQENRRLAQQLQAARNHNANSADLQNQVDALKRLLHAKLPAGTTPITASVMATAPNNFEQTITLDVGSRDGIKKDMAVVSGNALVGIIADVASRTSVVQLINDTTAQVGVRLPKGDIGLASGEGPGKALLVQYVPSDAPVKKGDIVTTSGLNHSKYPADIPIGKVLSVSSGNSAVQKTLTVQPLVDLRRLAYVQVLAWQH